MTQKELKEDLEQRISFYMRNTMQIWPNQTVLKGLIEQVMSVLIKHGKL